MQDESRLGEFEVRCFRIILKIRWEKQSKNADIALMTGLNIIKDEVREMRQKWLGLCSKYITRRHSYAIKMFLCSYLNRTIQAIKGENKRGGGGRGNQRRTTEREIAEIVNTLNGIRLPARGKFECGKLGCAYSSPGAESLGEGTHDVRDL